MNEQEIIDAAVEKALLSLPKVMMSLMTQHAFYMKANKDFYEKYPEFKNHVEIVYTVVGETDYKDTTASYTQKLEDSVNEIRRRIKIKEGLDMKEIKPPEPYVTIGNNNDNGVF